MSAPARIGFSEAGDDDLDRLDAAALVGRRIIEAYSGGDLAVDDLIDPENGGDDHAFFADAITDLLAAAAAGGFDIDGIISRAVTMVDMLREEAER